MPFSLDYDASNAELSEAVNYLLSNFNNSVSANQNSGQVIGPSGEIVSYLYKYIQVKYADSFDGAVNFSNTPTNRLYYGIRNNDSFAESTNPADYVWNQVTGGFGTTKFLWYLVSGGRSIQFQVSTDKPNPGWVQDDGSAIDLDYTTTASNTPANFVVIRLANDSAPPTLAEVLAAIGRDPIEGDLATVNYNSGLASIQYKYQSGGWAVFQKYITGDLIVANSIVASNIDSRNLTIKDASGNILLGAGTNLNYTNINPSSGWLNSSITINSDGTLTGAGSGQVSLGGLGAGGFAYLSQITSANVSTYIAGAAIGTAQVGILTADNIGAGTIDASKIAANTITAGQIAANTITGDQIAANTITGDRIAANTISAANIVAGTITGDRIAGSTITGTNIAGSTITGTNIAGSTITGGNIVGGTITGDKIAASTISAGNMAANSITAANAAIANAAVDTLQIAGQAVTIPSSSFTSSSVLVNASFSFTAIQTLSWTSTLNPTVITVAFAVINSTIAGGDSVEFQLVDQAGTIILYIVAGLGLGVRCMPVLYTPVAAATTVTLRVRTTSSNTTYANRIIVATEIKR